MVYLFYLLAALAGLSNPVQSAANAASNKATGQPVVTAMALYAVAVACLLAIAVATGLSPRRGLASLSRVPAWAYVNGLCNVAFVLAGAIATRRIGSAAFTVTVATCAILLSVVLDDLGALGLEQHALTWQRGLGAALAVAGIALVSLF